MKRVIGTLILAIAMMAVCVQAQNIVVGPINNLRVEKVYYNSDPYMDSYRIVWTWDRAWIPPSGSDMVYYTIWDEDGDQINAAEVGYFAETWDQGADYQGSVDTWYGTRIPFSHGERHAICVQACYSKNGSMYYGPKSELVWAEISAATSIENTQPKTHTMVHNYPNPFNPSTTIRYFVSKPAHVRLDIYNQAGRLVASLVNEHQMTGEYIVDWNADHLSSGKYFYSIFIGSETYTGTMILLK
jgi:hypothetical protein